MLLDWLAIAIIASIFIWAASQYVFIAIDFFGVKRVLIGTAGMGAICWAIFHTLMRFG